ncbi:DUF5107 domain-containing protein [Reichenbachiella ulvae]|uniref:DUF5107 domain-containing protein n=1 Tax=Reichenbachiella ulvae TaxID=2980104 RepID=A0ABT3CUH2_9BACT|nr:DUF5107 domain-containing protein [Reichenbachiella ulvae]MCV9387341.1 DUF5107 domain-containing protein [Reichenbachiella ulvae]
MNKVQIWQEKITIPTYTTGKPEKNPVFIEKRVYQGSSGSVYPYPVIEKIHDEKIDKAYNAVYLENEFVKIMILPEIGGRVQMAYDKTKQRHFVYYNQVIKPALVGLTGPWISGGIEFNWPQHHRPTTFDPVDFHLEENEDGSATVWCSELERMFRTKGMAGFTLHPDKSYLEIKVKLYNKTPFPQTFLWWANPAVKVNDDYQSIFPPDVHAVYDHGKRDVSSFPIAKGTYYKVDYSPGTDISRYKNIPVPTSYMAVASKYNFVGGYENDVQGGILHVADHHVSPGKKQWTWGNGDFGQAWDRNLTDEDGPYIELMCGVYTDNQPDFSWIMPNEQREFTQYFMPYRDLGVVKNATKDAMVNLEMEENTVSVKVYTTGIYPNCLVELKSGDTILFSKTYDASPANSFCQKHELPNGIKAESLCVVVSDNKGAEIVSWLWEGPNKSEIPEPAKPALQPNEIDRNEELFLTGQHIEQYRHATYSPVDYYEEALRRDPEDIRCNNAMGLWFLKRAKFEEAEKHLRQAVDRMTQRNPNPYDGEPLYNLGLCLKYQGKLSEAYNHFNKATWNAGWQNPAYYSVAQIDCMEQNWSLGLAHIEKSLIRNINDQKALHLKTIILRKLGKKAEAMQTAQQSIAGDAFNFGILYEQYLLMRSEKAKTELTTLIRDNIHNYIEYALDYAAAGCYQEGIDLLELGLKTSQSNYPMALYYIGWFYTFLDQDEEALQYFDKAAIADPAYCFPNQIESAIALKKALQLNPSDARALYFLGNYSFYTKQYEDAIGYWEKSTQLDAKFPTAFRNLALGYFNKLNQEESALKYLEKAFSLDETDARIFMELDQLYKRMNKDISFRLELIEKYADLVDSRDDVYLEKIALYNIIGQHEKAFQLLQNRKFHPWEGGEGKVTGQYVATLISLAKEALKNAKWDEAISYLQQSMEYPHNLGEGKLHGAQENDIYYWMGIVLQKMGDTGAAVECWKTASSGNDEPHAAVFYNDQNPDKILYQGLALLELGEKDKANQKFEKLISYGEAHLNDHIKIDYFAVSLPDLMIWEDDLDKRNQIHCHYLIGLGHLGLKNTCEAQEQFHKVLELDKCHLGAITHQKMVKMEKEINP